MSNLLASLGSSANALDVIQSALTVIQNNVSNASTPGYASQRLTLEAQPLDIAAGALGGLASGGLADSRNSYADAAVQRQTQALGYYTAQVQTTGSIQSFFDVSGSTGISKDLNSLLSSFSAWSTTPTDSGARQTVLNNASTLADDIRGLSNQLQKISAQTQVQTSSTVSQINTLAAQIRQYNVARLKQTESDPGADAQMATALNSLSSLVNFTALHQPDGTISVLLAGQAPLVVGTQQYSISAQSFVDTPAANPSSPPTDHVLDSEGNNITYQVTGGQLGGLLDANNRVLAGIIGDSSQAGSLNLLAKGLADTVNTILTSGTVSTATGAVSGVALFYYDNSDPTAAASSLTVNPAITADQLAPVDAAGNSNGNALALAALATSTGTSGTIAGLNFSAYFASIEAKAGQENQTAQNNQTSQQQVVTQAQALQDQLSGVSLDGQAAALLQFQRAYQAVSRVLTELNTLADSILGLIPQ